MIRFWCEHAWLGGDQADDGVTVTVDQTGRISNVAADTKPAPGTERLPGLTVPGFANAHSHAFQRILRGRTHSGRGDFWTWRKQMYAAVTALDPDSYFRLARATYAEMAEAGITVVGEFHYVHHGPAGEAYGDPNAMGHAMLEAAARAGIRICLLDTCYLHGGIGKSPDRTQRRFSDGDVEGWAARMDRLADELSPEPAGRPPMARIGAAIHSVRAVDPVSAARVAAWAGEHDTPLHAHVSEQPAENDACREVYGLTPSALLKQAGAIGPRFTAIHATHLEDPDFPILGEGGVCLCPTTERDLADGIGPARKLTDAGATLSTGSDSNAMIDPFEEMRAVELNERLSGGRRGVFSRGDLIGLGSGGGYRQLGWADGGRIEPGAPADLVTVALDSTRMAGTARLDLTGSLVYAASPGDVDRVIVGGRTIVREGRHQEIDVTGELAETISELDETSRRTG